MKQIYCISGLAADHRLFRNIQVAGYDLVPLHWLSVDGDETLPAYAARMATQITTLNPVIIGLSFGGMLATEIGKLHPEWTIFVVSGAKTSAELGYNNKLLRWLSRIELIPARLFNIPNPIVLHMFGAKHAAERKLLKDIIKNSDPYFMKWCIKALLHWNNLVYPEGIIQIHGTNDKVIRSANVHPQHWIEGGTHIMIYSKGREISAIIAGHLNDTRA